MNGVQYASANTPGPKDRTKHLKVTGFAPDGKLEVSLRESTSPGSFYIVGEILFTDSDEEVIKLAEGLADYLRERGYRQKGGRWKKQS